jgi:SAM-dependent methyltransferase
VSGGGEPDLAAFAGVAAGARILDVGSGRGRGAAPFLAAGARAVVLEKHDGPLRGAIGAQPSAAPVLGSALELPFDAGVFDAVVLRALLHHLRDAAGAVREAARVARPGGAVLLVDKVVPGDVPVGACRNAAERIRLRSHVWTRSEGELRGLATAARLEVEESSPWTERTPAEEWIAKGDAAPPWDGILREMFRADLAAGGRRFGVSAAPDGTLLLESPWVALRCRKPGARR